ncbi:hypothetical protein U14_05259 [Candidatus Moduliflexus flocculans]|uniref:Uncharacterized protein n=1 Tax=Candidatus Moduliflexus flocculans TaxID=1499966 RepID=A0A081BRF1_9BACT|nr:hypothetical protein U14_05259 [Candidatus Moduliflexus flocculans]
MLTVAPITMMIHAEEQAKHQEQNIRAWAEDAQQMIPSERPTSRWLAVIKSFAANQMQNALWRQQPTLTACCVEGHSCAHI